MAKFDVDEEALVAAAAAKVATMCMQDASFVQRLVAGSIGGLLSLQQLRATYDAGVKKALDDRIASAQATIAAIPIDLARWQRMAREEEDRWSSRLREAGQQIINDAKVRMRRTIREAVGDLLKDRVDEVLLKLLEVKQ
jgi:hypothetical protein